MELRGEYRIAAPRARVWAMLNDADVLRGCIPGCESLEGTPQDGFSARVTTKVGPVKATFSGAVTLSNVNAPESYTITGEGKGGVAGFAKGGADVHLAEDGGDTVLTYLVNAQVGGKLAQLGGRLIDSTAKKLADQFFACFAERAGAPVAGLTTPAVGGAEDAIAPVEAGTSDDTMSDLILPGQPIPPDATGVPIVDGQAAAPETVPPVAASTPRVETTVDASTLHQASSVDAVPPTAAAIQTPDVSIQGLAREAEQEVEREAASGFLGGPIVWGLLVILAIVLIYTIAT
jgi:carbon monoxide dehydrogenase subunit G